MQQPTDKERIDDHEERIRKLEQQQTEPIKVTRIEVDSSGVLEHMSTTNKVLKEIAQTQADHGERFDEVKHQIRQEFSTVSLAWIESLQENVNDIKADHSERFDEIKVAMATKDDITRLENLIKQLLPQKPSE